MKKRGGQPKHWADIARLRAWYGAIRGRGGANWTNHSLDKTFALHDQKDSTLRPRIFEAIELRDRVPRGRNPLFRGMHELIDAIEQHPQFCGTEQIFWANLWEMFKETAVSPMLVHERLHSILHEFSLVRCDPDRIPGMSQLVSEHGAASVYGRCLILVSRRLGQFKYIEVLWSIYTQLESSFSEGYRAFVESLIDEELQRLFSELFPSDPQNFYLNAIDALLAVRMDLSEWKIGGYGNMELEALWPIIPKEMLRGIKKEFLFPQQGNAAYW